MPNNDKIYQAYMGEMGEKFKEQVRRRISWIIDQVGDYDPVWDIGCSQGITSILLAQQGKHVTGIDIQPESIHFAKELIENNYTDLKDRLKFVCIDFNHYESSEKAKCIIVGEVIEHLERPDEFMEAVAQYLDEDGKLIITVPFGVINHPDHYSTFYMFSLYDLVSKYFNVNQIEFLGRWMGMVAYPKSRNIEKFEINHEAIQREEMNFLLIDKELNSRIEELTGKLKECNEKYARSTSAYKQLKETLEEKNKESDKIRNNYEKQIQEIKNQFKTLRIHFDQELKERLEELNTELEKRNAVQVNLSEALKEDVNLFDEMINELNIMKQFVRKLQTQNSYLIAENQEYRRKFEKITATWYGRILIKLYKFLQRVRKKFKR